MATFVHARLVGRLVRALLRVLAIPELESVVFSEQDLADLTSDTRVSPDRVHNVIYRSHLAPEARRRGIGREYVFTGGYSNRDYHTFFAAVEPLPYDVVAVASSLNRVPQPPPNVTLHVDLPKAEFEQQVADCHLLVLPLRASGEASGQKVLMRGMRYLRPVVATRHTALVDYLGEDYPGFVAPEDAQALRDVIDRGMAHDGFRQTLIDRISSCRQRLIDLGDMADQISEIVSRP